MRSFIWIGLITLALIALMFFAVRSSNQGTLIPFEPGVISPYDNFKGPSAQAGKSAAKVVVVEYSDFQCPACREYYPVMREMMAEFGDKVDFVYRFFPLANIHQNAEVTALAAEAAAKQNKFWEMHDLLFEKQSEWENDNNIMPRLQSYASLLGLSVDKFKSDMASQEVKDVVKSQSESALKLNLLGTPSFFINGVGIQNPTSTAEFRAVIQNALKNQTQ